MHITTPNIPGKLMNSLPVVGQKGIDRQAISGTKQTAANKPKRKADTN